jgi:hypothetical protein
VYPFLSLFGVGLFPLYFLYFFVSLRLVVIGYLIRPCYQDPSFAFNIEVSLLFHALFVVALFLILRGGVRVKS